MLFQNRRSFWTTFVNYTMEISFFHEIPKAIEQKWFIMVTLLQLTNATLAILSISKYHQPLFRTVLLSPYQRWADRPKTSTPRYKVLSSASRLFYAPSYCDPEIDAWPSRRSLQEGWWVIYRRNVVGSDAQESIVLQSIEVYQIDRPTEKIFYTINCNDN